MNWMMRLIIVLGVSCGVARAGGPPNFVVVLIDDMGWGDLSCFGNREGKTPVIDRLAAEGGRFSALYVNVWPDDVHTPLWPPVSDWREGKRGKYLAVLENLDRQLGVLFEFLRSDAALRENTLVLVCSDNGAEPGAGSGGPLRGCKGSLYEGGIRSPLVVWGPGLMGRERVGFHNDRAVLAAMDVVPSLLRLSGVAVPGGVKFDGVDASDVLLGKAETVRREDVICWRRPPDRAVIKALSEDPLPDIAVRDGEWKLLSAEDGGRAELYRVREDPGEAKNLAADNPDVVARLMKAAREWLATLPPGREDRAGE